MDRKDWLVIAGVVGFLCVLGYFGVLWVWIGALFVTFVVLTVLSIIGGVIGWLWRKYVGRSWY